MTLPPAAATVAGVGPYDVLAFGAKGDGRTDDAPAVQAAIERAAAEGGGTVHVGGARRYRVSPLTLRSCVELHVETGSVIEANPDRAAYRPDAPCAVLRAKDARDIRISGGGTFDGSAHAFIDEDTPVHVAGIAFPRPMITEFERCRSVTIQDISIVDTNSWNIHLVGCEDVLIQGIRIRNDLRFANADGIDPDHCRNVRIVGCSIETADDCIVLKNTARFSAYGPCENIVVSACTLTSTSSAFKIGSETVDDVRNVVVDSCVITRTNRGLGIQLRDGGNVENIRFSNCIIETRRFSDRWWGKAEPIWVTAVDRRDGVPCGKVRGVSFHNISCRGESGVFICGQAGRPVEDVTLADVTVEIVKTSRWDGGVYERRPCPGEGLVRRDTAGLFISSASDVALRNVRVRWAENLPACYGAALETMDVRGLELAGFHGESARAGVPAILEHGQGACL